MLLVALTAQAHNQQDGSRSDTIYIETMPAFQGGDINKLPKWGPGVKDGQFVRTRVASILKFQGIQ